MVAKADLLSFIEDYNDPDAPRLAPTGASVDITPTPAGTVLRDPIVAALEDGTFAVALTTSLGEVQVSLVDAALNPVAPTVTYADPGGGLTTADDILALPDGGFALAMTFGNNALRRAHVQEFDADGTARGGPVSLFNDHGAPSYEAQIERVGNGYAAAAATPFAEGGHLFRVYEGDWSPQIRTVANGNMTEEQGDLVPFRDGVMRLVEIRATPFEFRQEYYGPDGSLIYSTPVGGGLNRPVAPGLINQLDQVDLHMFPLPGTPLQNGRDQFALAYLGQGPTGGARAVYSNLPVIDSDPPSSVAPVIVSKADASRPFGTPGSVDGVGVAQGSRAPYWPVSDGENEGWLDVVSLPDGNALMLWTDFGLNATLPTTGRSDSDVFAQIVETTTFVGPEYGQYVNKDTVTRLDGSGASAAVFPDAAVNGAGEGVLVSVQANRYVIEGFHYIPQITGTGSVTDVSFRGTPLDDRILIGPGNNTVRGLEGDDLILDRGGDDVIVGGAGDDTIRAGDGDDVVTGGPGRDAVLLDRGDDRFLDSREGGAAGSDSVWGGAGDDTISGRGGDDSFYGETGRDMLRGGPGQDYLEGDDGAATSRRRANDTLSGGSGEDTLFGGQGNDSLTGGGGADRFVFGTAGGRDRVSDFEIGRDVLELDRDLMPEVARLTPERVVNRYAQERDGDLVLDFVGGERIVLEGIDSVAGLAASIELA